MLPVKNELFHCPARLGQYLKGKHMRSIKKKNPNIKKNAVTPCYWCCYFFFFNKLIEARFIDLFVIILPTWLVKTGYRKTGAAAVCAYFYFFKNFIGTTPHLHWYYHTHNNVLENTCHARNLNLNKLKTGTYLWQIMAWFEDILSFFDDCW